MRPGDWACLCPRTGRCCWCRALPGCGTALFAYLPPGEYVLTLGRKCLRARFRVVLPPGGSVMVRCEPGEGWWCWRQDFFHTSLHARRAPVRPAGYKPGDGAPRAAAPQGGDILYNSRDINDLRPDVAANCRVFLELCKAQGLQVMIAGTVRDEEYQLDRYNKGYSKAKRPSFHAQGVGLAFDFCKNVRGHEYDDPVFFQQCGAIGEAVGFEWGGRWKSFPDRPHLQWSGPGKTFKSSDILAGRLPPPMPLYRPQIPPQEEEEMTQEQFNQMLEIALTARAAERKDSPVAGWAAGAWQAAKTAGLLDGSDPQAPLTREQAAVLLQRLKLI